MIIKDCSIYEGRNIYAHFPVIRIELDIGKFKDIPTKDIDEFNSKLLMYLPGLKKHKCSKGVEGGFEIRLQEGTYLAHVIEHMTIEIQNMLGYDVKYGKARQKGDSSIYDIVFVYHNSIAGIESGMLAIDLAKSIIENVEIDFGSRLEIIRNKVLQNELGSSTKEIKVEAQKKNIPVMRIGDDSLFQLGYGKNAKLIQATLTENTSCIAVDTACDKSLAKRIMNDYDIPVPQGKIVKDESEALEYSERIGYPVVVKPNYGNHGAGVSINLKNPQEVLDAYRIAREYEDTVLVEKYIKGNNYRLLVVGDKLVAASLKLPAHVIGDGISTVLELINKENLNSKRGEGHEKPLTKIVVDKVVLNCLQKQGIDIDFIPAIDEIIYIRENDNLSTGGIPIDVTDEVHSENADLAILAAKIIGLDVAGVDIAVFDISKPIKSQNGAIIEINAAPGIRMHHYPAKGESRNAAKAIVDLLFKNEKESRIPIISVTGTNGKTTTTRLISHIIKSTGKVVGMTTTSGIYINNRLIKKGDNTGAISSRTVLCDKQVEYAVLETARGGIISKGLGYDIADVGIITNITEDHLGIDGINTMEDLTYVKSLIVEAVRDDGYAVINADDEYSITLPAYIKSNIIYISMNRFNKQIEQHIKHGGKAVFYDNGSIYIHNETVEEVVKARDIPITINGALIHNIYNAMSAIAGAFGVGIDIDSIRKGLLSFKENIGRFNIHDVNGISVVIDYGHNIDGYKYTIDALQKLNGNKLIGIIGVPGDRTDSSTLRIGEMCGNAFDLIYIKEDKDKRGRKEGEIAELLKQGCKKGKIRSENIIVELIEEKALEYAIMKAEIGDVIAVFYEEYDPLIEVIDRMRISTKLQSLITA